MVESLKLSITDQQLPMFIRILQLIISLYYGEIGGHKDGDGEEANGHMREAGANLPGECVCFIGQQYDFLNIQCCVVNILCHPVGSSTKLLTKWLSSF